MRPDLTDDPMGQEIMKREMAALGIPGIKPSAIYDKSLLNAMHELIMPSVSGLDHINQDMAFTDLDPYERFYVINLSDLLIYSSVMERRFGIHFETKLVLFNRLETFLVSSKSKNARSMSLFNQVVTKSDQSFQDMTKKESSSFFNVFKQKRRNDAQ